MEHSQKIEVLRSALKALDYLTGELYTGSGLHDARDSERFDAYEMTREAIHEELMILGDPDFQPARRKLELQVLIQGAWHKTDRTHPTTGYDQARVIYADGRDTVKTGTFDECRDYMLGIASGRIKHPMDS